MPRTLQVRPELTGEDGHAVKAAVQLAEQDGEKAVRGQHAGIPGALVIDNHVLWLRGLHLGAMRAEVSAAQGPCWTPPAPLRSRGSGDGKGRLPTPCCLEGRAGTHPPLHTQAGGNTPATQQALVPRAATPSRTFTGVKGHDGHPPSTVGPAHTEMQVRMTGSPAGTRR